MGRRSDPEKHRYWEAQVRGWRASGLTQSEYCRRQGIGRKRFGCWKRRLGGEASQGQDLPVRFVPVAIRPEAPGLESGLSRGARGAALTVVTGEGYRIEVGDGFTPATLVSLVWALGRA